MMFEAVRGLVLSTQVRCCVFVGIIKNVAVSLCLMMCKAVRGLVFINPGAR
jgi:hypothetical protein